MLGLEGLSPPRFCCPSGFITVTGHYGVRILGCDKAYVNSMRFECALVVSQSSHRSGDKEWLRIRL